jgi:hypothetical protein
MGSAADAQERSRLVPSTKTIREETQMHPHPAFREVHMHDRAREIAKATRLAHFERPDDPPARFSLVERAGRLRARIALNNA